MFLKRVEMENFKSFGKTMEVPFRTGFTAITGPNGSGKSNIADAILFVLGPRSSKQMRAGNLKDLIFNGGKDGSPADHCKVTLVFDNEDRTMPLDADEVRLTRRVKISPSDDDQWYSYYYINGDSSKHAEFENLLSHARINPDGYNIVQQGDIGQIVEMSSTDRREILDDLAGITKFDDDIEQANRERGEVEDNLERVKIKLEEIERRMEDLDEEKDKAKRYKELKDDLSTAELELAIVRRERLQARMDEVQQAIDDLESDKQTLQDDLEQSRQDLQHARQRFRELEERIETLGGDELEEIKQERKDKELQMWQARDKARDAREEIQDHKEQIADKQEQLGELQAEIEDLEAEVADEEEELEEVVEELETKQDDLEEAKDRLADSGSETERIQTELAEMKQAYSELQDELHEKRLERDRIEEKVERAAQDIAEMEEKLETHEFEVRDIEFELEELRDKSAGKEVQDLEDQLQGKRKEASEIESALSELEPKIKKLNQKYSQLKAEKEAKERVSKGYTRAVEAVLEARDKGELDGIHGAIAELGSTEDRYETAVATAAGGRLQCVIVETDEHAQQAIEHLKSENLGRATFLPLSKMSASRPRGKARMAERSDEAVGFALDLVDYDEEHEAAFWYVFGDTVVMDDIEAAREHMGGVRMVTLDGEKVEASGAMTGGSSKNQRLKLGSGTREELEEIAEELREANDRQDELSGKLQEVRQEIAELEQDLETARDEAGSVEDRVADLEMTKREHEQKIEPLEEGLEKRRDEKADADEELASLDEEIEGIEGIEERLDELDEQREAKSKELTESADETLRNRIESLKETVDELKDRKRDLSSSIETTRERIELQSERAEEVEQAIGDLEQAIEDKEELAETKEEEKAELDTELDALKEMEAEHEAKFQDVKDERDDALEAKKDLEAKIERIQDKIDTKEDMVLEKRTRIPEIEQELADVEVEINQRADEAEALEPVEAGLEDLKGRVKSLEAKIEAMGDINMKAIEEHQQAKERAEELQGQVDRLEEQREELIKVVEEITKKKKDGLFEVLSHIDENFQRIYAELSDGGEAEITLENPEEPFEGGLTLKAQPRGKSVHRLEALSGGERALTSMAFIFAIQEYMPSPFYVLDEIDQNLDAVNAEKVGRMIKDNSERAQFIVVSLRRVTLKEAEHVYGVTMNRPGISDIVGNVNVEQISKEGEFQAKAGVTT